MASRKDELNKAKEAGKSIVANKFASEKTDAPKESAAPIKKEEPKKEQSLVANKFGAKKEKTWNDVKSEYNNDPAKIADYLNNATDYTPGSLTKKGMEEFGYSQGTDGKWSVKPKTETKTATETKTTADGVLDKVDEITSENQEASKFVDGVTNPKDGSVDEQKVYNAMSQYEQKMVEMGAGSFDEDGKFVFKDTTKKGWEDWATMLSVGASVIGLAMGVPIMPINFRKITNKDEKDAKIREFQKQYTDIMAGNAAKVKDVESSKEAGDYIKENQESIDAFTNYVDKTASYKAKSDIDTDSEKELIETRTDAQIRADQAKFDNDMKRLDADNNFKLNYAYLQNEYGKDFAAFTDALSTNSAKELLKYQNTDMLKEIQRMVDEGQIDFTDMAKYSAMKQGIRPSDVTWNRVMQGIDAGTKVLDSVGNTLEALNPLKIKK